MKRYRVIQMVEDLKTGGMERVIQSIAMGLDSRRFDVETWCVARGGAVADEMIAQGLDVKILGILDYHSPGVFRDLAARIRRARPDVVHTHGYYASTLGRTAAWIVGVPVIVGHVHSTYHGYRFRHLLVESLLARMSQVVLTCSAAVGSFVRESEKVPASKVRVVLNGVPEPVARADAAMHIRQELGIGNGARMVVTVASLFPHKGHRFLVEAVKGVMNQGLDPHLVFVGDGPCRGELEAQAANLGLGGRVHFAGIRKDIGNLLWASDLFVLPSCDREGLSIAIIEAMALGKAVVATDLGGIPEVVRHGKTGLLVQPGDAAALAVAVSSLLADTRLRERMGSAGRRRYEEKFTLTAMTQGIEAVYDEFLR